MSGTMLTFPSHHQHPVAFEPELVGLGVLIGGRPAHSREKGAWPSPKCMWRANCGADGSELVIGASQDLERFKRHPAQPLSSSLSESGQGISRKVFLICTQQFSQKVTASASMPFFSLVIAFAGLTAEGLGGQGRQWASLLQASRPRASPSGRSPAA